MSAETRTRNAEFRTESPITDVTDVWVASDVPGSPVTSPFANVQY